MNDAYLDLLARCLSFALWPEPLKPINCTARRDWLWRICRRLDRILRKGRLALAIVPNHTEQDRREGRYWPALAHTMIGELRLANIRDLCGRVVAENVPGAFVECGVWRGGASIYARACLPPERPVICCDSFEGLPPDPTEPEFCSYDWLAVPLEEVRANFEKYGLLANVQFVKGWFKDTLAGVPGPVAILRSDGDTYSSTLAILAHLFPKVSPGGYVIIDDWWLAPCRRAVTDYFHLAHLAVDPIHIDGSAIYWRKEGDKVTR